MHYTGSNGKIQNKKLREQKIKIKKFYIKPITTFRRRWGTYVVRNTLEKNVLLRSNLPQFRVGGNNAP
jgi:hypothetical protein